jgi:hypothetical protein
MSMAATAEFLSPPVLVSSLPSSSPFLPAFLKNSVVVTILKLLWRETESQQLTLQTKEEIGVDSEPG